MRLVVGRDSKVGQRRFVVVFCKKIGDFLTKQRIELRRVNIFVAGYTFLDTLDNLKRGLHAYIRGYEHLFEIVENLVVDF